MKSPAYNSNNIRKEQGENKQTYKHKQTEVETVNESINKALRNINFFGQQHLIEALCLYPI